MDSGLQQLPFRALAEQDDALSWQAENHSLVESPLAGLSQAVLDYFSDALKTLSDRLQALDLNNQFTFLATILHFFVDHLPDTPKPELQTSDLGADAISLATSELPLAHVPQEAAEQVPEKVPPEGLPQVAVDQMSDAATDQLAEHVDWLNDGDQFIFPDLHALSQTLIESTLLRVQAADGPTQVELNPMADAAADQFTGHLDWLKIGDQLTFQISEATHQASNEPPLSHVSDQGTEHVPEQVPPHGLPDQAVNMAPTATEQLEANVPWLLQADQLAFSPSDPLQTTSVSFDANSDRTFARIHIAGGYSNHGCTDRNRGGYDHLYRGARCGRLADFLRAGAPRNQICTSVIVRPSASNVATGPLTTICYLSGYLWVSLPSDLHHAGPKR